MARGQGVRRAVAPIVLTTWPRATRRWLTLSPGRHLITLAATDKDGNTLASINVYAGGKIYLPLVRRGQ